LLAVTEVPQERFPIKRVYEIAAEGEDVMGRWVRLWNA